MFLLLHVYDLLGASQNAGRNFGLGNAKRLAVEDVVEAMKDEVILNLAISEVEFATDGRQIFLANLLKDHPHGDLETGSHVFNVKVEEAKTLVTVEPSKTVEPLDDGDKCLEGLSYICVGVFPVHDLQMIAFVQPDNEMLVKGRVGATSHRPVLVDAS